MLLIPLRLHCASLVPAEAGWCRGGTVLGWEDWVVGGQVVDRLEGVQPGNGVGLGHKTKS